MFTAGVLGKQEGTVKSLLSRKGWLILFCIAAVLACFAEIFKILADFRFIVAALPAETVLLAVSFRLFCAEKRRRFFAFLHF